MPDVTVLTKHTVKAVDVIGGLHFIRDTEGHWRRVVRVDPGPPVKFYTLGGPIGPFSPDTPIEILK